MACTKHTAVIGVGRSGRRGLTTLHFSILLMSCVAISGFTAMAQAPIAEWQIEVRNASEAHHWDDALHIVEREIALHPTDMDVRAWRARVLLWSGRVAEAEHEYSEILRSVPSDPDNWTGLAAVYMRQGRIQDALNALDHAVQLDPKRADTRAARGRILRAMGKRSEARFEFQRALDLDSDSLEARSGLLSLICYEPEKQSASRSIIAVQEGQRSCGARARARPTIGRSAVESLLRSGAGRT